MPHISATHYDQGRAIYDGGGTVRQLTETAEQLDAQREAAHDALEKSWRDDPADPPPIPESRHEAHSKVDETYRNAAPSLIAGFLDGLLVEIRRITRSRGQTA